MDLKIVKSVDLEDDSFLNEVLKLDSIAYSDDLQGTIDSIKNRYEKNTDSYLLIYDKSNIVGYLCFFPISDTLLKNIYESDIIYDDNIEDKDILKYNKNTNNIYIISMVIHPDYRDGDAIKILLDSFVSYMKEKNESGYKINKILGTAVSPGGIKVMKNLNFDIIKNIENNYKIMECTIDNLKTPEKNYKPSYSSDIYIMVPFSNLQPDKIVEASHDDISRQYLDDLNLNSKYECDNRISNSLKRYFIGKKKIIEYTDEYNGEIVSSQDAYCFLTCHIQTRLALLTICIPNCKSSSTQLADQVSVGKLDFMIGEDIVSIKDYLYENYDLKQCGSAKTIFCLSNKPDDEKEFYCMLSGEAYNSKLVDYKVASNEIKRIAEDNISQYDFYDAYVSVAGVVYIYKDFSNSYSYNIKREVPVLFILELTMFQNMAITRTNDIIVEELQKSGDASFGFIEKLYREFGKTIVFWNKNNFKYNLSQNFANKVIEAFKISENIESYNRNQGFIEKIIELKDAQSSHKENMILNIVVIMLTMVQILPILIQFVNWILDTDIVLPFTTVCFSTTTLIIIILLLLLKRRNQNKNKL